MSQKKIIIFERKTTLSLTKVTFLVFLLVISPAILPLNAVQKQRTTHVTQLHLLGAQTNSNSSVKEFALPQQGADPLGLVTDSHGNVWFGEGNTDRIVEFVPSNQSFRTFRIPMADKFAWVWTPLFDASGNLWFATTEDSLIWRFDPTTQQFANFTTGSPNTRPYSLDYDNSSNEIWFTSLESDQFGAFKLSSSGTASLLNVYYLPSTSPPAGPAALALDGRGSVYITYTFSSQIGKFSEVNGSAERIWTLPEGTQPASLAIDSSRGLVWFTNHASSDIGYLDVNSGKVREFATSSIEFDGSPTTTLPYWIYLSSSGMLWFNEHVGNRIARFNPTTLELTEFSIPTPQSEPIKIALDDERSLVWFSEFTGNKIGMLFQNSSIGSLVTASSNILSLSGGSATVEISAASSELLPLSSITSTAYKYGTLGSNFTTSTQSVNATTSRVTIQKGSELAPGNYTLTLCSSEVSGVKHCALILVQAPPEDGSMISSEIAAAVVILVALGISLFFVRKWRRA